MILHIGFSWLLGPEVDEESVFLHNLEEVFHSEEFLKGSEKVSFLLEKVKVDLTLQRRFTWNEVQMARQKKLVGLS